MKRARVVVVGSYNQDHVWSTDALPAPGATRSGRYGGGPGGKGFNQAVAAARAGAGTVFLCALGDDATAMQARALAAAEGIDLRDEVHADLPSGSAGIFVDAQARNVIVVAPGANAVLGVGFIEEHGACLADARVLLAQLEVAPAAVARALALAREQGALAILNPAPADAATTPGMLALADVLTPNETEFAALLERHAGLSIAADAVAGSADAQLHGWCRELASAASVVVTLGGHGVFVSHPDGARRGDALAHYRIAAEDVRAIDTTGAGDAFSGALAAALARAPDQPFAAAVAFANRYAALSTEGHGAALAMPLLDELQRRFAVS